MRLIYLAGPYAHEDLDTRVKREGQYAETIAYFIRTAPNLCLFSSVLHNSAVAINYDIPSDFSFWAERDFFMIKKSSAMWVLTLKGWQESYGVSQEIEYAESISREVLYVVKESTDYVLTDARPTFTLPLGD